MKITPKEVVHVATLARLELDDDAISMMTRQIDTILEYVDTLGQVDTQGVSPTTHAIFLENIFRKDTPKAHLKEAAVLANAPESAERCFVVPKVI